MIDLIIPSRTLAVPSHPHFFKSNKKELLAITVTHLTKGHWGVI